MEVQRGFLPTDGMAQKIRAGGKTKATAPKCKVTAPKGSENQFLFLFLLRFSNFYSFLLNNLLQNYLNYYKIALLLISFCGTTCNISTSSLIVPLEFQY